MRPNLMSKWLKSRGFRQPQRAPETDRYLDEFANWLLRRLDTLAARDQALTQEELSAVLCGAIEKLGDLYWEAYGPMFERLGVTRRQVLASATCRFFEFIARIVVVWFDRQQFQPLVVVQAASILEGGLAMEPNADETERD